MSMINRYDISEKFASMWRKSRTSQNKSQEYMARALGVSKATVQHWEDGTSCPSQKVGMEWFSALGVNPLPYYLDILYPEFETLSYNSDDKQIEDALIAFIKSLPASSKRKLLYCAYGKHGASPICALEMITAHLHTPLHMRLNVAQNISSNYQLAKFKKTLICSEQIQPDIQILDSAIAGGREAVFADKIGYW